MATGGMAADESDLRRGAVVESLRGDVYIYKYMHMNIYIYIYMSVCVHVSIYGSIYMHIERKRHIYMYIYYIYIYVYRGMARAPRAAFCSYGSVKRYTHTHIYIYMSVYLSLSIYIYIGAGARTASGVWLRRVGEEVEHLVDPQLRVGPAEAHVLVLASARGVGASGLERGEAHACTRQGRRVREYIYIYIYARGWSERPRARRGARLYTTGAEG